jgi:hypothetical protein
MALPELWECLGVTDCRCHRPSGETTGHNYGHQQSQGYRREEAGGRGCRQSLEEHTNAAAAAAPMMRKQSPPPSGTKNV